VRACPPELRKAAHCEGAPGVDWGCERGERQATRLSIVAKSIRVVISDLPTGNVWQLRRMLRRPTIRRCVFFGPCERYRGRARLFAIRVRRSSRKQRPPPVRACRGHGRQTGGS
jgi:hypothetical protein